MGEEFAFPVFVDERAIPEREVPIHGILCFNQLSIVRC